MGFADINNAEYNINIETYYLTGTTMVFFIQMKDNITRIYWFLYYFCQLSLMLKQKRHICLRFRNLLNLTKEFGRSPKESISCPDISISIATEGKNMVWYRYAYYYSIPTLLLHDLSILWLWLCIWLVHAEVQAISSILPIRPFAISIWVEYHWD